MGLGKSAQAIRACEIIDARTVLVICRAIAREQWKNEFKKFSDRDFALSVSSYESIHKLPVDAKYDVLIIDEAHYVKEPNAKRTQNVLGKFGLVRKSGRVFLLTGTPTPNHPAELWPILYTFGRTKLTYDAFIERYCDYRDTGFGRQITGAHRDKARRLELLDQIKDFCLRRSKREVMSELPPIFFQDLVVPPGKVELGYSADFTRRFLLRGPEGIKDLEKRIEKEYGVIEGIVDGKHLSDATIAAFQANAKSISTVRRYVGLQKVDAVAELVTEELDSKAYDKIVLFTWHKDVTNALHRKFKRFNAACVYGGTDPVKLEIAIRQFQEYPRFRVLIANFQTAGTSITLTAANQVMFVEQSFVPADMQQAVMRCHRIGQTKPVTVRYVGLEKSIDQHIAAILRRKTEEITELMDGLSASPPPAKEKRKKKKALTEALQPVKTSSLDDII